MAFKRFSFTKVWTNPSHFPTVETDEVQVRADMQVLHDESKDGLNNLMTALEGQSAAGNLGAVAAGGTEKSTVQEQLNALHSDIQTRAKQTDVDELEEDSHTHANAAVLDATQVSLTSTLAASYNRLVTLLKNITSVATTLGADNTSIPTSKAVQDAITASGSLPGAGTKGQVLTKQSSTNFDCAWTQLTPAGIGAMEAVAEYNGDPDTSFATAILLSVQNTNSPELYALGLAGWTHVLQGAFYGYVGNRRRVQIAVSVNGRMALRVHTGTDWGAWKRIAGGDEVLPLTGGTLTGNLSIGKDADPTLRLIHESSERETRFRRSSTLTYMHDMLDDENYSAILLAPETTSETNLLRLKTEINGTDKTRNILHTGNLSELNIPRMVTGSYTGNDADSRTISLGFTPRAVLLKARYADYAVEYYGNEAIQHRGPWMALTNSPFRVGEYSDPMLSIGSNGFTVADEDCRMNNSSTIYDYVAWG